MGHLSPLDGIGPEQLGVRDLEAILNEGAVRELILATNPTVEGEATAHFLGELATRRGIRASRIAHGVPIGGELEYVDGGTLGMVGKVQVVRPPKTPCLQCTMNKTHMAEVARRYSCTGAGMTFVEAAVPAEVTTTSIVAAVQAREALKLASGRGDQTIEHRWYYDGLKGSGEVLQVSLNPSCPLHIQSTHA